MKRVERKYARFYYDEFIAEFPAIYADDAAFAAWMRLLTLAEKVWPSRPELPRSTRPSPLRKLVDAGLIRIEGVTYRVRGLDAERLRRSGQAKAAADARWTAAGNADSNAASNADSNAETMPSTRKSTSTPPSPPHRVGGRRKDGTNPRAVAAEMTRRAEQAEAERKAKRRLRHLAYLDGRITEAQRDEMDERDAPLEEIPTRRGAAYQVPA